MSLLDTWKDSLETRHLLLGLWLFLMACTFFVWYNAGLTPAVEKTALAYLILGLISVVFIITDFHNENNQIVDVAGFGGSYTKLLAGLLIGIFAGLLVAFADIITLIPNVPAQAISDTAIIFFVAIIAPFFEVLITTAVMPYTFYLYTGNETLSILIPSLFRGLYHVGVGSFDPRFESSVWMKVFTSMIVNIVEILGSVMMRTIGFAFGFHWTINSVRVTDFLKATEHSLGG